MEHLFNCFDAPAASLETRCVAAPGTACAPSWVSRASCRRHSRCRWRLLHSGRGRKGRMGWDRQLVHVVGSELTVCYLHHASVGRHSHTRVNTFIKAPAARARRAARRRAALATAVSCRRHSSMVASTAQLACRAGRVAASGPTCCTTPHTQLTRTP